MVYFFLIFLIFISSEYSRIKFQHFKFIFLIKFKLLSYKIFIEKSIKNIFKVKPKIIINFFNKKSEY